MAKPISVRLTRILMIAGRREVEASSHVASLQVDAMIALRSFSAAAGPTSPTANSSPSAPSASSTPQPLLLGPSVRLLLAASGIDVSSLRGSGPRGIITKADVLSAIAERSSNKAAASPSSSSSPAAAAAAATTVAAAAAAGSTKAVPRKATASPAASSLLPLPATKPPQISWPLHSTGDFEDIPTTQIRRIIGQRLMDSRWGSPHTYAEAEALIDATLSLRKELKDKNKTNVSVNDFVIKAVAVALSKVEEANMFWDEKRQQVSSNSSVDISIAVATDKGLITPIVRDADKKSLVEISKEVRLLAEKARAGKLLPHEFQGGTFTISNLGMFSVDRFAAIINPPQSGILAVGRGAKAAVWEEDENGDGRPVVATKMEVTISGDARVMGGNVAGKLLRAITENLSNPQRLLL